MVLDKVQIIMLNWFYNCHKKGETASFKGSMEHFGEILKVRDPMNVLKSLLDAGLISLGKSKFEVSITREGIRKIESLKKNNTGTPSGAPKA